MNGEEYIIQSEITDSKKKEEYWNIGIGLNKVDNLEPSKYLLELSQKNIKGELKYYEIETLLKEHYEKKDIKDVKTQEEKECDLVSTRIAQLLEQDTFSFYPLSLKSIHKFLFKDIYDFAGEYREYNISKKEHILNGETVKYVNFQEIDTYLEYDFNKEKEVDYSKFNKEKLIENIAKFDSSIWQVHPFAEGNTRTTAVFIEKYLRNMGFSITNNMFKEHSIYYRNALVRSSYGNIQKGIYPTNKFLIMFFENLLYNKNNNLDNDDLCVRELF